MARAPAKASAATRAERVIGSVLSEGERGGARRGLPGDRFRPCGRAAGKGGEPRLHGRRAGERGRHDPQRQDGRWRGQPHGGREDRHWEGPRDANRAECHHGNAAGRGWPIRRRRLAVAEDAQGGEGRQLPRWRHWRRHGPESELARHRDGRDQQPGAARAALEPSGHQAEHRTRLAPPGETVEHGALFRAARLAQRWTVSRRPPYKAGGTQKSSKGLGPCQLQTFNSLPAV